MSDSTADPRPDTENPKEEPKDEERPEASAQETADAAAEETAAAESSDESAPETPEEVAEAEADDEAEAPPLAEETAESDDDGGRADAAPTTPAEEGGGEVTADAGSADEHAEAKAEVEAAAAAEGEETGEKEAQEKTDQKADGDSVPEKEGSEAEEKAETKAEEADAADEDADSDKASKAEKPEAADEDEDEPKKDPEVEAELAKLWEAHEGKEAVEGKVIGWNKGGYHVAIGKIAAFCPVSMIEVGNPRSPKRYVDKKFDFHVIEIQDGGKRIVLSRAAAIKAERKARAKRVKELLEPGKVMKGKVSTITDFGAFVDLGGRIEGLVHISELSRQRVDSPSEVVKPGQEVEVQVLKVEKGGKRISLSMKRLEDDPWDGVEKRYERGQEFEGTIVRRADFGLFVEVEPGLEGLVHVSRLPLGMSFDHESLEDGQEVEGWVQKVEPKRRRMSLSLQPVAEGDPWEDVEEKYPEGELTEGTVERLADFGAFIQLEPGLTGLLPFSMIGDVANPKRQYHAGKEVKVKVLAIDKKRKRISLGTEHSKAEGSSRDYKEFKQQLPEAAQGGMNTLAAALAKVKDKLPSE